MNKNPRQFWIAAIGSVFILTVGGTVFYQMFQNHLENQQIIEECFEYFDQEDVVIVKESSWSTVSCINAEK